MDFNLAVNEKFIDYVFRFLIAINLYETTTYHFFGIPSKNNIFIFSEKAIKYSSLSQIHICVRLDFLHVLQPHPNIPQQTEGSEKM